MRSGSGGGAAGERARTTDAPPLTFTHTAPDTELLAIGQRVLEALIAHDAAPAHLFCFLRRSAALREEQVGIDAQAVRLQLPAAIFL